MRRVKEAPAAQSPRGRWRRWLARRRDGRTPWLTIATVGTLAVASTAVWGWRENWHGQAADWALDGVADLGTAVGLTVRDVLVVGRAHTPKAAVMDALGVERGAPILGFDPYEARERLMALPWIDDAVVERILPDTIVVRVIERKPLALWQYKRVYQLVDAAGRVMAIKDPSLFADLPLVVGEGAPSETSDLLAMLTSEPELFSLVEAAVRVGDRRWNLHMKTDTDVLLPEVDAAAAWRRLADYQRQYHIVRAEVRTLDLRFSDRLIVRPASPAAPEAPRSAPRA